MYRFCCHEQDVHKTRIGLKARQKKENKKYIPNQYQRCF